MAADFAWVTQLHPAPPGSICTVPTSKGPFTGRVFDFGTLITHTLLNFLLSDVAVHQNRGQVITFMESAGFTNVRVKRGKSSANGRENVWLVEATRSGDGVTGSPAGAAASASAAACDAAAAGAASSCGEDGAKGDDTKKDGEGR